MNVSSVPSATARSLISTSDSPGSSTPPVQRQLMLSRSGFTTSRYSPLLSCSLPSSMRKRTRKRPPTRGSVSATSTGPPSGPHQLAMPSAVVSASKTIDGRALIRRTSVRLVIVCSSSLRLPCLRHRPRADRGCRPEAFVAAQPIHGFPHGLGPQPYRHGAPDFRPGDEAGIIEHVEMLHHGRQLDREGLRQRADGCAVFAFEPSENRPPGRVDERRECPVEPFAIVHHLAKYRSESARSQPPASSHRSACAWPRSASDPTPDIGRPFPLLYILVLCSEWPPAEPASSSQGRSAVNLKFLSVAAARSS